MGIEFIHRVIKTSLITAAVTFLFGALYYKFHYASGILVGCGWGCLNLFFLTNLVTQATDPKGIDRKRVVLLILFKFPLLYLSGYFLLRIEYFPVTSLLVGFTLIFVVILLKALGRMIIPATKKRGEKLQAPLTRPGVRKDSGGKSGNVASPGKIGF
jgi:hypothetical protein